MEFIYLLCYYLTALLDAFIYTHMFKKRSMLCYMNYLPVKGCALTFKKRKEKILKQEVSLR